MKNLPPGPVLWAEIQAGEAAQTRIELNPPALMSGSISVLPEWMFNIHAKIARKAVKLSPSGCCNVTVRQDSSMSMIVRVFIEGAELVPITDPQASDLLDCQLRGQVAGISPGCYLHWNQPRLARSACHSINNYHQPPAGRWPLNVTACASMIAPYGCMGP